MFKAFESGLAHRERYLCLSLLLPSLGATSQLCDPYGGALSSFTVPIFCDFDESRGIKDKQEMGEQAELACEWPEAKPVFSGLAGLCTSAEVSLRE